LEKMQEKILPRPKKKESAVKRTHRVGRLGGGGEGSVPFVWPRLKKIERGEAFLYLRPWQG